MEKQLQTITHTLPLGSVEAYTGLVNRIPILSAEEEQTLAKKFREQGDLAAARQLVMAHLRFVVHIARGYAGYGLPQADLIQEGSIGLMKAVKRFDPKWGVRLASFAIHWIKAEIHEFVIRNWRIVKVATTKAQRKLFFNLRKMAKNFGFLTNDEVDHVAETLKVSPKEVRTMEQRLSSVDTSFYASEEEEEWSSPANTLADDRYDPARLLENHSDTNNKESAVKTALASLDERARDIVSKRWLAEKKATLHDLAAKYSISAERVRQLENQAMSKLKVALSCHV